MFLFPFFYIYTYILCTLFIPQVKFKASSILTYTNFVKLTESHKKLKGDEMKY